MRLSAVGDEMIKQRGDSSSHHRVLRPLECGLKGSKERQSRRGMCRCHSVHHRVGGRGQNRPVREGAAVVLEGKGMKVKGQVQYSPLGFGTWVLETDSGETYQLYNPPVSIQKEGLRVEVEGRLRDDIMTVAMVGRVLEVIAVAAAEGR